jgi:hypothetical protein
MDGCRETTEKARIVSECGREFVFEWLSVPENNVRKLEVHERNLV